VADEPFKHVYTFKVICIIRKPLTAFINHNNTYGMGTHLNFSRCLTDDDA